MGDDLSCRHGDFRHGGGQSMGREQRCSRAITRSHHRRLRSCADRNPDRPEAEPRPCGIPSPVPLGDASRSATDRPVRPASSLGPTIEGCRSPALCLAGRSAAMAGCRDFRWRRTRNGQNPWSASARPAGGRTPVNPCRIRGGGTATCRDPVGITGHVDVSARRPRWPLPGPAPVDPTTPLSTWRASCLLLHRIAHAVP